MPCDEDIGATNVGRRRCVRTVRKVRLSHTDARVRADLETESGALSVPLLEVLHSYAAVQHPSRGVSIYGGPGTVGRIHRNKGKTSIGDS